jgi:hypothetical protein
MDEQKNCREFQNYEEARKDVEEEFLETISLFRSKRHIEDAKLEIHYSLNEKGVVDAYFFVGKVKFGEKTIIERDGEDFVTEEYVGVMEYVLTHRNGEKEEKLETPREKWVLENVIEGDDS